MTDETPEVAFDTLLDALLDTTVLPSNDPPPAPSLPQDRERDERPQRNRGGRRRRRD